MMTIIDEDNWKAIAEMIGVEIGVPFKVKIPPHLKEYMRRAIDDDIENLEYCIYEDGFACHDACRSSGNDFTYNFILGGILNNNIQVLRPIFRPTIGTTYYYVDSSNGDIEKTVSQETHFDFMNFVTGNIFRTYEEAVANRHIHFNVVQDAFSNLYS